MKFEFGNISLYIIDYYFISWSSKGSIDSILLYEDKFFTTKLNEIQKWRNFNTMLKYVAYFVSLIDICILGIDDGINVLVNSFPGFENSPFEVVLHSESTENLAKTTDPITFFSSSIITKRLIKCPWDYSCRTRESFLYGGFNAKSLRSHW